MSNPASVRARLEALRDAIYRSHFAGTYLAKEVESMEHAYSIERRGVSQADFLVPTSDQTGRNLAEPLDESGLRTTLRHCRERCVRRVLELRKWIDSAFNAVRQAADLVNDPNAAPEQRWSAQIVRELQTLRGAILVGHDPTCQPSALPMIRAGVPEALRQAVAPLEPRFDRVKSLILELCGDASEPDDDSNPTGPADSPAARSESGSQSSLGPPARRETATIPTRAGSDDRVVPTGGGVPTAPSYLGDVRDFVAKGEACVAEAERWRQEDGHFVSPGLDRRWRAPFESIQKLYAQKIAPLCAYPWESLKVREFPGWVREHHADGEDRIMLNEDCGHVVARLATEQAGHDTVRVPIVRVGDAKALLLRLRAWLARFEQRDSGGGAARGGNTTPNAPAIDQAAIERLEAIVAAATPNAIDLAAQRAAEKVAKGLAGDKVPVAKLPKLGPHDRQAWQLWKLAGKDQAEVARLLNNEHGLILRQGQVSRMCVRFQKYIDAGGVAGDLPKPARRARVVDPARTELGAREDKRTPRPSDMARANDDDE